MLAGRKQVNSKDAKRQCSHKRPLEAGSSKEDSSALRGPGGGAIEGPPLLGRISAGSAHGGLEYYRYAGLQGPLSMLAAHSFYVGLASQ